MNERKQLPRFFHRQYYSVLVFIAGTYFLANMMLPHHRSAAQPPLPLPYHAVASRVQLRKGFCAVLRFADVELLRGACIEGSPPSTFKF